MTESGPEYKPFWDAYSDAWESSVRKPGQKDLGDEWGNVQLVQTIIDHYVKPHLPKGAVALEIGCGGLKVQRTPRRPLQGTHLHGRVPSNAHTNSESTHHSA